ncbi:phospholipase D family protein [Alsobacter sp. KACC 23698]|uniref:Phospholipase D family protein n=1 Tax=Alsobacter sp. KACC 23698 TaxID=3149229 RepID=A0AAU7JCF9_9HYPH
MSDFIAGDELSKAIKDLMREENVRCAVAFWGVGAETLLPRSDARVICNLKSGGTNPWALRKLATEQIRQSDTLHAKVYLGATEAIVASANASANGLGLEGEEQAFWTEAGVRLSNVTAASDWFEKLWETSRDIRPEDWRAAQDAWRARQREKTTSLFSTYYDQQRELPMINWVVTAPEYEFSQSSVEQQLGAFNETIERRIDDGLDLEHADDVPFLVGKWVLCWRRGKGGLPRQRTKLWWVCLSDVVVRDAYRYVGESEPHDVVLGAEVRPPAPFDATEKRFEMAFRDVLTRPDYAALVEEDYTTPWFASHAQLVGRFWRDLKERYDELPKNDSSTG